MINEFVAAFSLIYVPNRIIVHYDLILPIDNLERHGDKPSNLKIQQPARVKRGNPHLNFRPLGIWCHRRIMSGCKDAKLLV